MSKKKALKSDQRYFYEAVVTSVYDGDTFTLDIDLGFDMVIREQKIRLAHVDTPEIRGKERTQGLLVRDCVREMILGKTVYVKTIEKSRKGAFGRWIADVYFTPTGQGKPLSTILIEQGHAKLFVA